MPPTSDDQIRFLVNIQRLLCDLSGVNYFFGLTTIISPYRVASPINVTELVDVVVCLISWDAEPIFCLAQ